MADPNKVELLLFGGVAENFKFSFCEVKVTFDEKDDDNVKIDTDQNVRFGKYDEMPKYISKSLFFSKLHNFMTEVVNNRYLLIIGGSPGQWEPLNSRNVLCLDLIKYKWTVFNSILPKRAHISIANSVGVSYDNGSYNEIFVMHATKECKLFYKINFWTNFQNFEWKHERIMWIGYYQNDKNPQCIVHTLPKVIVEKILNFVRIL